MLAAIRSCGLHGIDGCPVLVEVDISNGIPAMDMVGLADTAVREAKERVRAAIRNSGFEFPVKRITINLAPASLKKEGAHYDLAVAVGILTASGQIDAAKISQSFFAGELALDGSVRPVRGVLPMAAGAKAQGAEAVYVAAGNAEEAAVVQGLRIYPVEDLTSLVRHLSGEYPIQHVEKDISSLFRHEQGWFAEDFADVRGQEHVKRAMEVAASGAHNILMLGSPGSGKTMLAKRLAGILPALNFHEALEVTKIYSISGLLPSGTSLMTRRPFRSPHHTISPVSLVGGGSTPRPGEISLSHYGVLFLDEVPEFSKEALEVLRQPLEDGLAHISRVSGSVTYPARTMLVLAANPCSCGKYLEKGNQCSCSPQSVSRYMGRLSGPLLDRIDLHCEVTSVSFRELEHHTPAGETSADVRARVQRARGIQEERYREVGIMTNAELTPAMLSKWCRLDAQGSKMLGQAFDRLGLSARAHGRILKVARTIADMEGESDIRVQHLAEAIQYRNLDRRFSRGDQ